MTRKVFTRLCCLAMVFTLSACANCGGNPSKDGGNDDGGGGDGGDIDSGVPLLITSITPQGGPSAGGTSFTLVGTGFTSDLKVTLGGKDATSVTVKDDKTLLANSPAHAPGTVDVVASNSAAIAILDGGWTYTCRIDDDCEALNLGLRCDDATGTCIPAKGCNDDTNCDNYTDPTDYCYHYGLQCRCVTPETNDAGTNGVCRRRRGVCEPCTIDAQCGQGSTFEPGGICVTLQGDSTGTKYCLQSPQGITCPRGMTLDPSLGVCAPAKVTLPDGGVGESCQNVGCFKDKDCPQGSVCDEFNGVCEPRCKWDFATQNLAPPGCPPSKPACWVDEANLDPTSPYYGAGRCRPACSSNFDCYGPDAGSSNLYGGYKEKCAPEIMAGGGMSPPRCRANGQCMDNLECPVQPPSSIYLGYCDRGTFQCKTDCRVGVDPLTGQSYKDCRPGYKCEADGGANACVLKTCHEEGGAFIACRRGQYCCGDDKNGDGVADPCPPVNSLDPNGCYDAPSPPFCKDCTDTSSGQPQPDDSKCLNPALPQYLTGTGACANGSKSPSCSPLPPLCIFGGLRNPMDQSTAVFICGPATWNDQTKDSFGVTKEARGCPQGYGSEGVKPVMNQQAADDYCLMDSDCNVGTDAGKCLPDPLDRKRDGGTRLSCMCYQPGFVSNCPNSTDGGVRSVCRYGPNIPNICVVSVVCHPNFNIFLDAGDPYYGCGL